MSDQQLKNLLRECQELLPMSWHDCDDSECSNDLCERHRGHAYVSKRIDAIADLDGRIDDALAGHVTTDSGFREFGIVLTEIEKAYEAIGAPKRDQDPDARDPAYIGDAVARAVRDLKFQGAETATLAELQAERDSNAGLRERAARLQSALSMFASIIKSGERWSDECQKAYDEARL